MSAYVLALLAALFWGLAPVLEKVALRTGDAWMAVFVRTAVAAALCAGFFTFTGGWGRVTRADPKSVVLIVLAGIASAVVGQAFYFKALRLDDASRVVPIAGTYPLIASALSVVFLGEPLTLRKGVAVAAILAGIALLG